MIRPVIRGVRSTVALGQRLEVRWNGLPSDGKVHVSYGHRRVSRPDQTEAGGIVKLQDLGRLYPNSPTRFNLLYLVSSRLPHDAVALARTARAMGARVVVNQNGVAYPAWHGAGWERTNAPMAELLGVAAHVFYQSRFCKETADRFLGVEPAHWEILYNAVDTDRFVPGAPSRSRRGITLLLGGSQDAFYRVATALRALASYRLHDSGARLLITGRLRWTSDRTPREDAERLAAELGVSGHVEFLGPYAQTQAPAIYQRADVLLHTKYNDPCPSVVIEAMACGLPVVHSASGGVPELVGDGGIGVPTEITWDRDVPPSPEAMAVAVHDAVARRRELGAAARRRAVERFDVRPWLARHEQLFRSLVS